jgi:CBS domain-containing protein/RNA polymerase-binding transcription factor DksA
MSEGRELPRTTVEKWKMPDPVWIRPDVRAADALALMAEHGVRHLPVLDEQRRVVGVISHNDLRAALPFSRGLEAPSREQREAAEQLRVGELMSHAPETVGLAETLERAARVLADRHLGCLPVVDAKGRLLGMFTETDALRALVSLLSAHGEVPSDEFHALVAELQRERWRLSRRLEHQGRAQRERLQSSREVPGDAVDDAALNREEAVDAPLAELAARRLAALDHALARAARGQLASCERCGGAIAVARLRALPGTDACARCASSSAALGARA